MKVHIFLTLILAFSTSNLFSEMIYVKGGYKMLGDVSQKDNLPHKVYLDDFWISDREVTVGEWKEFLEDTKYYYKWHDDYAGDYEKFFISDESSMGIVTFFEAALYCNWRSRKEGLKECYKIDLKANTVEWDRTANGYRLPTESEWEYAARGGQKETKTLYAGNNNADEVAWYDENSGYISHPVGLKKKNELDLYDMSGNVSEWCFDYYHPDFLKKINCFNPVNEVPEKVIVNEAILEPDLYKVIRGGGWSDSEEYLKVYNRNFAVLNARLDIGIRLIRNHDTSYDRYLYEIEKNK